MSSPTFLLDLFNFPETTTPLSYTDRYLKIVEKLPHHAVCFLPTAFVKHTDKDTACVLSINGKISCLRLRNLVSIFIAAFTKILLPRFTDLKQHRADSFCLLLNHFKTSCQKPHCPTHPNYHPLSWTILYFYYFYMDTMSLGAADNDFVNSTLNKHYTEISQ